MSGKQISVLLISPDEEIYSAIEGSLAEQENCQFTGRKDTVSGVNGSAISLTALNDVVLFDVEEDSDKMLETAQSICDARMPNAIIIALAPEDLPLEKARQLKKLGVDDVLPRTAINEEIVPQVDAIRTRRQAQLPAVWGGHATLGKVIAVAKSRGGVGSSLVAANMANELQQKEGFFKKKAANEVAVVDLDFQFGSIAALMDVEESDAMWRMAMEESIPDTAFLDQAMSKAPCGVDVLAAPSRYGPLSAIKDEQIDAILDSLRRSHDYVVVDLPRALVEWITPVLAQADRLYLVTDVAVPSVRSARKLIDFYHSENPALDIQLVASLEKKPLFPAAHHRAATKLLEKDFSYWVPKDERTVRESVDRGVPLQDVSNRAPATRAIKKLADDTRASLPPRVNS
ncbi:MULTISPECIES: AAA family ATPase [unclassified Ruegeria]|uniref:AAA family ATPase n=1 Tax=unclassified Ruegeria TaxID=2625375 RepID=UPI001ADC237A|nr:MULTISPECIES: AAA family ATPase [unclassified Ruegeria]MBO9411409.1 AAA family ATPase [Ruegeria sp. R8_1]MBO9416029.1 AAA family ATPase [Ruegeria sp. R8_2]